MTNEFHDPTCRDVEQCFDSLLSGRLNAGLRARIERHMESCPSCRDLAEVAGAIGAHDVTDAPDLTTAILSRTAGDPCDRARELLCDLVDGTLDPAQTELVRGHAKRCAPCGRAAAVLETLAIEMPRMAVVEPDPKFVRDVMTATLGPDGRWRLMAARLAARWAALVTRPRFGLEAAYVGAMLLFALFALPFSPLHGVPERLLALTDQGSAAVADASSAVGQVPERVAVLGDRAWDATGAQGVASLRNARRDLNSRYERTEPARQSFRENSTRLREAARDGNLPRGRDAIEDIGTDLGDFVRLISVADDPGTENDTRPLGAGRG